MNKPSILITGIATLVLYFFLSLQAWGILAIAFAFLGISFAFVTEYLSQKELAELLKKKGSEAQSLISEMKIRHDNALLTIKGYCRQRSTEELLAEITELHGRDANKVA